jgi:hypothetical protein
MASSSIGRTPGPQPGKDGSIPSEVTGPGSEAFYPIKYRTISPPVDPAVSLRTTRANVRFIQERPREG